MFGKVHSTTQKACPIAELDEKIDKREGVYTSRRLPHTLLKPCKWFAHSGFGSV